MRGGARRSRSCSSDDGGIRDYGEALSWSQATLFAEENEIGWSELAVSDEEQFNFLQDGDRCVVPVGYKEEYGSDGFLLYGLIHPEGWWIRTRVLCGADFATSEVLTVASPEEVEEWSEAVEAELVRLGISSGERPEEENGDDDGADVSLEEAIDASGVRRNAADKAALGRLIERVCAPGFDGVIELDDRDLLAATGSDPIVGDMLHIVEGVYRGAATLCPDSVDLDALRDGASS